MESARSGLGIYLFTANFLTCSGNNTLHLLKYDYNGVDGVCLEGVSKGALKKIY